MKELLIRAILVAHYNYVNAARTDFIDIRKYEASMIEKDGELYTMISKLRDGSISILRGTNQIELVKMADLNAVYYDTRLVNYSIMKILKLSENSRVYWTKTKIIIKQNDVVVFTTNRIKRIAWSVIRDGQYEKVERYADLDLKEKQHAIRVFIF